MTKRHFHNIAAADAARDLLGFQRRPGQEEAIRSLLARRDTLLVSPPIACEKDEAELIQTGRPAEPASVCSALMGSG